MPTIRPAAVAPASGRVFLIGAAAIASWCALSWWCAGFYTDRIAEEVLRRASAHAARQTVDVARGVEGAANLLKNVPLMLANDEAIRNVLRRFGPDVEPSTMSIAERQQSWSQDPELARLSAALGATAAAINAESIEVLNAAGDAVAGAAPGRTTTPVGTNFADRLDRVRLGESTHRYIVGRVIHVPGLNDTSPVFEQGRFIGAVVVRNIISSFTQWVEPVGAFLADSNGVVVLAANPDLEMGALPNAGVFALADREKAAQYKRTTFNSISITSWDDGRLNGVSLVGSSPDPVILGIKDLSADGLTVYLPFAVPELANIKSERPLLFALLSTCGSLFIIAVLCTWVFLVKNRSASRIAQQKSAQLEATFANMPHGLCMFDAEQRLVMCNENYARLYGFTLDDLQPGVTLREIFELRIAVGIYTSDQAHEHLRNFAIPLEPFSNRTLNLSDGRIIAISHQPMPDGGWVTQHTDITESQRAQERIALLAHHDPLTGLPNRTYFMDRIQEASARFNRHGEAFSVFMLDLDRFKVVNDSLGHPAGDALLRATALRLKSSLRETDVLARLGGDEFAIIQVGEIDQRAAATALAGRIINFLNEPLELDGNNVTIGTSVGIALAPKDGTDPMELLKKADLALYLSKSEGRNDYRLFDVQMTAAADERHQLENDLRNAISRQEIEVHYQPIVDVNTRRACAVEALARWRHPTRGLIPPDLFVPLAEETGLIVPLGQWVLQKACIDAAAWPSHIKVAVNLSAVQFRKSNLLDVILCALVESGLSPERLELEITESVLLENEEDYSATIRQLKNLGLSFALDDFGTGYSSLSYLTKLPFDKIKIDRSFTQNLSSRTDCAAVVSSVLVLGMGLKIKTLAEGVETQMQFEMLRGSGIDFVQGYLFGRPGPASELDFDRIYGDARVEHAA